MPSVPSHLYIEVDTSDTCPAPMEHESQGCPVTVCEVFDPEGCVVGSSEETVFPTLLRSRVERGAGWRGEQGLARREGITTDIGAHILCIPGLVSNVDCPSYG